MAEWYIMNTGLKFLIKYAKTYVIAWISVIECMPLRSNYYKKELAIIVHLFVLNYSHEKYLSQRLTNFYVKGQW